MAITATQDLLLLLGSFSLTSAMSDPISISIGKRGLRPPFLFWGDVNRGQMTAVTPRAPKGRPIYGLCNKHHPSNAMP